MRLTGFSTPFFGASWEYTEKNEKINSKKILNNQKIKVFISSICGIEKYDEARKKLKSLVENTNLAEVYTFESKGASILTAKEHYELALKDSDICIFLIDNLDGISQGVQNEIDIVQKYNIKALYYFCDENQKEKTGLEQSLTGANFAKSKTVHSFEELSQNGAQDLINDIVCVYHYYCKDIIDLKNNDNYDFQNIEFVGMENYKLVTISKDILKNVSKCSNYILNFILGYYRKNHSYEVEKTSELDSWGMDFLQILFEGKSIKNFNTSMYIELLKEQQGFEYNKIVESRWYAIQEYFSGNIKKCIDKLEFALDYAKEKNQPTWIIKDILLDLRNLQLIECNIQNKFYEIPAQKELTESKEELYYPVLDRINKSLHEKYIEDLYKNKIKSPYTLTLGNDLRQYGEMLASYIIVSMYNASLTHIILIYDKIKMFLFYLSCKYDDWDVRLNLYKFTIFNGDEEEIKGIQNVYPELLSKITSNEAEEIMNFCLNHSIKYKRLNSQLRAFGTVGYFLEDERFKYYEEYILEEIKKWINNENRISSIGNSVFKCLEGVSYRMSQNIISDICCLFIEKNYSRYYMDMFRFITKYIDLENMDYSYAENLIEHINTLFNRESDIEKMEQCPSFLFVLRKQNKVITESLDKKISKYMPTYYKTTYKLETTENKEDMLTFIDKYIEHIKENNENQGKEGVYFGHRENEITTLRLILSNQEVTCNSERIDSIVSLMADTILTSKESIYIKLDAIKMLIFILLKYEDDYFRNKNIYEKLFEERENVKEGEYPTMLSNIDSISLKIGLCFLYISMGKDVYEDILELMPYIQGDVVTTNEVTEFIAEYLETTNSVILPSKVESIILHNVLQWLNEDYLGIRWNALRILLKMSRNNENHRVINNQLMKLIDSSSAHIKNLIIRNINVIDGITDTTKEYIISKCKNDTNFVVRMVCYEIENEIKNNE